MERPRWRGQLLSGATRRLQGRRAFQARFFLVERLTGMEMDEDGVVSWIENSDWQELRRRLDAQGGPPVP